ncbi:MAG: DUF3857 domain-containing transglutaminase family protein [Bacteroidota bacterium]
MKSIILSFLFLIPTLFFANSHPEYSVSLIDSSMRANANAVIRSYHSTFEVQSAGEAKHRVKMAVTRFNDYAYYEDVEVAYDMYSKVNYLKVNIYDAYGKLVRKFKKSEIADVSAVSGGTMYADDRLKYLNLEYGKYPYTIEYEYEWETKSIFLYPSWRVQQFRTSVEHSKYELILPKDISVQHRLHHLETATYAEQDSELGHHRIWSVKNIAAKRYESGAPERDKQVALGFFIPDQFAIDEYEGDMSSWESFGAFIHKINAGRDVLSPKMIEKVEELTEGLSSEEEKIAALYRYMQDNMRYVSVQLGIGGWQTFDAQYVEENKFGDCKALSNFMKSMLKAADIPAYTTLVYAGDDMGYEVSEDFSFPYFNHAILHVPSTNTWLECTSNIDPPNYLGTFTANRNVLLITENGGQFARTPSMNQDLNWTKNKTHITIDTKGSALVQHQSHISGAKQEWYRAAKHHLSQVALAEELLQQRKFPSGDVQQLALEVSKNLPEAKLDYHLNIARYAAKSGKRLFIPVNRMNTFSNLPDAKKQRQQAYEVRYAYVEQDTITIQLPKNARVESTPKDVELSSDYGYFQMQYTLNGQQLSCVRTLEMYATKVAAKDFEAYRSFLKKIIKKDKGKLVVVVNQA